MKKFFTAATLRNEQVKHAFYTRQGGVSQGIYSSLNVCPKFDNPEHVAENRAIIAHDFGIPVSQLVFLKQTHSNIIHDIKMPPPASDTLEGDGMITTVPNIALAIRTADCVPVLLLDEEKGIIGALHAGWRGMLAGIIPNMMIRFTQKGSDPERVKAALGPYIFPKHYQIDKDLRDAILKAHLDYERYISDDTVPGKYRLDLDHLASWQLTKCGVYHIEHINHDTYAHPDLFFSCRYAKAHGETSFGDQASVIMKTGHSAYPDGR